ncbi:MAG: carbohydrate porin [Terricaulis sp.]
MTAALLTCAAAPPAFADDAVSFSVEYTGDVVGPIAGAQRRGQYLDNLDLSATFDMQKLVGWGDTTVFLHVLNNSGGTPNDAAQTLQGVDNIEVTRQSARLYEFWIETNLGPINTRAGLYDINSEFYANDSAGLLMAPAFGIGSELAATGPNGPSIFPSTALAARFSTQLSPHGSARVAIVNANAGVIGDPDGVDTQFDDGALIIGELSWNGRTSVDVGAWTYTDKQDDIRLVDGSGDAISQRAAGAYISAEREIWTDATVFARVGLSDGDTTPYVGGWQAGVLFTNVIPSRADSQLSIGAYQGRFGSKFRANQRDDGLNASSAETGIELTYSDQVTPWLRLQPDVQVVLDPNGDRDRQELWTAGLRFTIAPFGH